MMSDWGKQSVNEIESSTEVNTEIDRVVEDDSADDISASPLLVPRNTLAVSIEHLLRDSLKDTKLAPQVAILEKRELKDKPSAAKHRDAARAQWATTQAALKLAQDSTQSSDKTKLGLIFELPCPLEQENLEQSSDKTKLGLSFELLRPPEQENLEQFQNDDEDLMKDRKIEDPIVDLIEDQKIEDPLFGNPIAIAEDCRNNGEKYLTSNSLFKRPLFFLAICNVMP